MFDKHDICTQDAKFSGQPDGNSGLLIVLFPDGEASPAQAADKLQTTLANTEHPFQQLQFLDTAFYPSVRWLREFAALYQERIGWPFACRVRVDLVTEEAASLLAGMGCETVALCVAPKAGTGASKDGFEVEDIRRSFAIMRQHGIARHSHNLIGLPGETLEQALRMVRLNAEIDPDGAQAFLYSGSEEDPGPVEGNEDLHFLQRYYWPLVRLYGWGRNWGEGGRRRWVAGLDRILGSRWLPRRQLIRIHRFRGGGSD